MDDLELVVGEYVLVLRGNVVEVFHTTGLHHALHILHLAVEGKPRRDGDLDVRIGIEVLGDVQPKATVRVPPPQQEAVMAFFQESSRRRDALRG